ETKALFLNPGTCEAARLTGCKNLSRAKKLSEHKVKAIDWNLELFTAERVPDSLTAVGIRAHDIKPSPGETSEDLINTVRIEAPQITEMPFEWNIAFGGLLWKLEKSIHKSGRPGTIPEIAMLPPECILLLEGEL
ncbi:MAG: ABC transporter ATP-binding protein, partial [Bacillota bacterium]|nr:ABC transporter ATP-binding protein [Bacillota bacterium]